MLLAGAILHVLYAAADKTPVGVATFLSNPARTIAQTLRAFPIAQSPNQIQKAYGEQDAIALIGMRLRSSPGICLLDRSIRSSRAPGAACR